MFSEKLQNAINDQIAFEFHSALLYKAMQAYFEDEDLPGFANWMDVQFQEELFHANKFFTHVAEAGARARIMPIEDVPNEFSSPLEVFRAALAHEQIVTARIGKLMDIAREENNHAAQIMLQWFITEQVEEEASAGLIIRKLERVEGDGRGLLMLDQELAQRVFTPPTDA